MRIAVVESDPVRSMAVCRTVGSGGHICCAFGDAQALIRALRRETFDLMIVSDSVADMPGVAVLEIVRTRFQSDVPVLFMAGLSNEDEIVSMLNHGADDFVAAPYSAEVLLARVRSLLRRTYASVADATMHVIGGMEFELADRRVTFSGRSITLTKKQFSLALLLFQHLNRPLSRAHILDVIWSRGNDVAGRSIDTYVSILRSKLNLRPEFGFRLSPIYGYGYCLEHYQAASR